MNPCSCGGQPATRLLVVPGLYDSGAAHWQTWLQGGHRDAVRVTQRDWSDPQLDRWAARIDSVLERGGPGPWVAVAHSFGALALVAHLASRPDSPVAAALLVAPADPARFGVGELLPQATLGRPSTVVASQTDPWMPLREAQRWARRWGSQFLNLGDAGHINTEAGFGPLPLARQWVLAASQRQVAARRVEAAGLPLPSA
jgi:predicted alpha/beta hydrolase family esterase